MESILKQMIKRYSNESNKINSIKQVIQECVLASLSKTDFFDYVSFYGGTALRIFYGLDRFSEDMDFSLKTKNESFLINKYLENIEKDLLKLGLKFNATNKNKTADTNILSAFIKGNTKETILQFDILDDAINEKELIKIKLEVDVFPPDGANFENKYLLLPYNSSICVYDEPSLFAGKLHALICRAWKNRIKGRDLYDYLFYLKRNTAININHLKNRLIDSGYLNSKKEIMIYDVKKMLLEKFDTIDFESAKKDVFPFVNDIHTINVWDKDFFTSVTNNYFDNI